MQHVQTRLRRSRLMALCMAAVFCISVFITAFPAFAAVESVKSLDGNTTYINGGATYVLSDTTVLVTYTPGDYFYAITTDEDWVGVYYDGVAGQPNGSYFTGNQDPAVNGGFVTNIGAPSASNGGIALASNPQITVAFPGDNEKSTLIISTYSKDVLEIVYTHTFISTYSLSTAIGEDDVSVNFNNNSSETVDVIVILAAYDAKGRLLFISTSDESLVVVDGAVSLSIKKQADAAYYKAFAWESKSYVPLLASVTVTD